MISIKLSIDYNQSFLKNIYINKYPLKKTKIIQNTRFKKKEKKCYFNKSEKKIFF